MVTLRGDTHTTTATFGAPDTVFDGSNCGSGVIRWCAHHLQHLGPPWGIGGNDPNPRDGRTLLGHLQGGHTHLHNVIRRSQHLADTVFGANCAMRFGCRSVVCTSSSAASVGPQWGIGGNAPTPQGWQDTPWSPSGGTHTPPQPLSALPTPYSTARIAVRVSFGGVHTIFSS